MDYRFFVNVDSCISEERYGHFFYKNRSLSSNLLKVYSSSTLGYGGTFREQSADILSYINRFPHTINEYQIIFAIQSVVSDKQDWEHTLLSKLLNIDYYLREAGIVNSSGDNPDCCINIFVVYKLVSNNDTQIDQTNYIDKRFSDECRILSNILGIHTDSDVSYESFKSVKEINKDNVEKGQFFQRLFERMLLYAEQHKTINIENYIRSNIVSKYNINELFVNNSRLSEENCATFKIIEYITSEMRSSPTNTIGFKDRCIQHWDAISSLPDAQIKKKYARLMGCYRANLEAYVKHVEQSSSDDTTLSKLPEYEIPHDDDINDDSSFFGSRKNTEKQLQEPIEIIEGFEAHMSTDRAIINNWETAYGKLITYSEDLNRQLKAYEIELRRKYTDVLKERQFSFVVDSQKTFLVDKNTEIDVENLCDRREHVLEKLKESQIAPHIMYQNQLNLENKIRQANENIEFYIDCISAINSRSFLLLILFLIAFVTVFYVLLQPSVLLPNGILFAGIYLALVAIIMSFCWGLPRRRYKENIKQCLNDLKKSISGDLENYKENARKLRDYVNYSSILDYLERQIKIRKKALTDSNKRENAKRYYMSEALSHINRLSGFSDLINTYFTDDLQSILRSQSIYPQISGDGNIVDIVDCELFWPIDTGESK